MKIVYVLDSIANSGGIERVVSTKANYFADCLGYDVYIVVASRKPIAVFFDFSPNIQFHYLDLVLQAQKPWNYFLPSRADREYERKLSETLIAIKPDITISTFGRNANFLYRIEDGSRKVLEFHFTKNYLLHLGDSLENDRFRRLRRYWLQFLLNREEYMAKKYDHIVLLTERDKQLWGGDDKFTVIPNPLSFQSEKVSLLDSKTIVSMGRLVYPKGFQYLIRAFVRIHDQFPDWTISIYGEGHDRERLQKEINSLSLQDKIFLKKPEEDVSSFLLDASLFVLPTLYDGFGLVLVEAMECGVPCIAFDSECGPGEIIRDGEDGYLVEPKNIELLAQKMALLMKDKELRIKMAQKAKENVTRFSMEKISALWQAYFESVMKI